MFQNAIKILRKKREMDEVVLGQMEKDGVNPKFTEKEKKILEELKRAENILEKAGHDVHLVEKWLERHRRIAD